MSSGRQTVQVRLNSWATPVAQVPTATPRDASGRLVRALAAQVGLPAGRAGPGRAALAPAHFTDS